MGSLGEFGSVWPSFAIDILRGGYDIVHCHSFRHPHTDISATVAKLAGPRSVLTSHSPFHPPGVRLPLARSLVQVYDGLLAPITLKAYDAIISLTPAESAELQSLGAPRRRISVIPNGVDGKYFDSPASHSASDSGWPVADRMLLYLGRINRTKGLDVLVRAFSQTAAAHPDAQLVIAGPTTSPQEVEFRGALELLTKSLRLEKRVLFTGRLSEEDKVAMIRSSLALVLPSLYEPFGIVILEAAALGRPAVATSTDGPGSIIRQGTNGLLVPPGDVDGLAAALSRVLSEPDLLGSMSAQAREVAEGYRWERIVDKIAGAYSRAGR